MALLVVEMVLHHNLFMGMCTKVGILFLMYDRSKDHHRMPHSATLLYLVLMELSGPFMLLT